MLKLQDNLKQRFTTQSLRADLLGGVTTAVISLPLSLAFGVASGAGAQAGLYGAIIVGFFAALFGGTRTLISEPTGPMTVLMTTIIATMLAANPEHGLAMAFAVVLVAGLTQVLLGALKIGRFMTLMPHSVISGFMSGIGVLLIIMQLGPLLGHTSVTGDTFQRIGQLFSLASQTVVPELLLGVATLAILFTFPKQLKKYCPPHLGALVVGTIVTVVAAGSVGITRLGEIPSGLPSLVIPMFELSQLVTILQYGILLGLLGSIDTLLTAVIADNLTHKKHNSNRELVGQGIGNFVSGLFGGLPGAGATMGTVVNIQTGATSPLSGITRALTLVLSLLLISPLLSYLPLVVLSAIAMKVGIDIIDWKYLKQCRKFSLSSCSIMLVVLGLTVFVDLVIAVLVGVFLANMLTVDRLSRLQRASVKLYKASDPLAPLNDEERAHVAGSGKEIALLHLSGPMVYGAAQYIPQDCREVAGADAILIDLQDVTLLSTSVALAVEGLASACKARGMAVHIVTNHPRLERLDMAGTNESEPNKVALHGERTSAVARISAVDEIVGEGVLVA